MLHYNHNMGIRKRLCYNYFTEEGGGRGGNKEGNWNQRLKIFICFIYLFFFFFTIRLICLFKRQQRLLIISSMPVRTSLKRPNTQCICSWRMIHSLGSWLQIILPLIKSWCENNIIVFFFSFSSFFWGKIIIWKI